MKSIIVFAGSSVGSVLSLLEQIKNNRICVSYVVCLNPKAHHIFEKSIFVDYAHSLNFSNNSEFYREFRRWFLNIGFDHKPIIYFTTDTSCYLVNMYREWFEKFCELCLPSSEIISTYTKKGIAEQDAEKNGLRIPKTRPIRNDLDLSIILESFQFPVIIKPQSTYETQKSLFKVKLLDKEKFHSEVTKYLIDGYSFVCQEYIPGEDENAFFYIFYRSHNALIYSVVGRKILQNPPRAGIMAKGLVESNSELVRECESFLRKIDYKGIGGIEFKKYNGTYYFIEMSTRLEGFFKITSIAGVPLGLISYDDNNTSDNIVITKQKDNTMYIDLFSMISAYRKQGSFISIFRDCFSLMLSKNIVLNVFNNRDKRPFLALLNSYLRWK